MNISSHFDLNQEMQEIYLHRFLNQLGKKLVSIFIPLYLLNLGFNHFTVILFFLSYFFFSVIGSLPGSLLASRFGYKKTSLAASPLIIAYYYLLRTMEQSYPELALASAIGGIGLSIYWMGMNPEVSKSSHREKDDREAGLFFSIPSIASVAAPAVGGILVAISGFPLLFSLTIGLILISFLPLALTPEHSEGMDINFRNFLREFKGVDFAMFMVTGSAWLGQIIIWPLFLATILSSTGIGGSGTLMALGGAITSLLAGIGSEKFGRKKIIALGGITSAITFIGMSMVSTALIAFIVSGLNGFFLKFVQIPIYGTVMERSNDSDLIEYFLVREFGLNSGRILTTVIIGSFFFLLPLQKAFLASFSSIVFLVLIGIPIGWKMVE